MSFRSSGQRISGPNWIPLGTRCNPTGSSREPSEHMSRLFFSWLVILVSDMSHTPCQPARFLPSITRFPPICYAYVLSMVSMSHIQDFDPTNSYSIAMSWETNYWLSWIFLEWVFIKNCLASFYVYTRPRRARCPSTCTILRATAPDSKKKSVLT